MKSKYEEWWGKKVSANLERDTMAPPNKWVTCIATRLGVGINPNNICISMVHSNYGENAIKTYAT